MNDTATIHAPPPTEPSNPVPCRDDVLSVEWRGRTLLIPRVRTNWGQREVHMSAELHGVISIRQMPYDHISCVEIAITRVTMTRKQRVNSAASGELGTNIADLLADACEGIDLIPDEFWELMAAPLEGDSV